MTTKIIAICGHTMSNKSSFALSCLQKYGGIIVNADSRQIFKGLPILTACPIDYNNHLLYEIYHPNEKISVYDWIIQVKKIIKKEYNYIWLVGGSGFYIHSLKNGIYHIPESKNTHQLEYSYDNLYTIDPKYASIIDQNDHRRIIKAIDIYNKTGYIISNLKKTHQTDMKIIYLYKDKDLLYHDIEIRTKNMFIQGVIEEVKDFTYNGHFNPIGLAEIRQYISGNITQRDAIEKINVKTRQYAKKQKTWFNNHIFDIKYNVKNLTYCHLDNIIEQVVG